MSAYNEDIYNSRVTVTANNLGREAIVMERLGKEFTVAAGEIAKLGIINFKDFRVCVGPKAGRYADVELDMKFDKPYKSNSWKLLAVWSDGP